MGRKSILSLFPLSLNVPSSLRSPTSHPHLPVHVSQSKPRGISPLIACILHRSSAVLNAHPADGAPDTCAFTFPYHPFASVRIIPRESHPKTRTPLSHLNLLPNCAPPTSAVEIQSTTAHEYAHSALDLTPDVNRVRTWKYDSV